MTDVFLRDDEFAAIEPLNAVFGRLGSRICAGRRWIDIADAASFVVRGRHYATDHDNAFFADGSYWQAFDAKHDSLVVLSDELASDGGHVYWRANVLVGIEPDAFKPLSKHYALCGQRVMYLYAGIHQTVVRDGREQGVAPIWLDGADPTTFQPLEGLYGRDAKTLFYHSSVVTRTQVPTTEMLDAEVAKTAEEVFFEGTPVEGAEASTFMSLGDSRFYRDAHRVYFARYGGDDTWLEVVEGAHASSFRVQDAELARDRARAYRVVYGEDHCWVEAEAVS